MFVAIFYDNGAWKLASETRFETIEDALSVQNATHTLHVQWLNLLPELGPNLEQFGGE